MIEPSKLHAYVDGELSDAERREVESRLAECQASQSEVASIMGLKAALGGASNMESGELWANCKSRLDAIDRVEKSGNFITKYSWAFVSAVAMVVLIGGGFSRRAQASSVDSSSLAGVFSNSSKISPEKIARNAQLDSLLRNADKNLTTPKPIQMTSGTINGLPAVKYIFEDGRGRMILIALPEISSFEGMTPNADGKYFYGQIEAHTKAVGWKVKGEALILLAPREYADLENIARTSFVRPE